MIGPFCGGSAQRYQFSRQQQAKAQRPRPSIRGTPEARERARRAALARWRRSKSSS
jgi:hypothetical protein